MLHAAAAVAHACRPGRRGAPGGCTPKAPLTTATCSEVAMADPSYIVESVSAVAGAVLTGGILMLIVLVLVGG